MTIAIAARRPIIFLSIKDAVINVVAVELCSRAVTLNPVRKAVKRLFVLLLIILRIFAPNVRIMLLLTKWVAHNNKDTAPTKCRRRIEMMASIN